jgi:hypothetical protein
LSNPDHQLVSLVHTYSAVQHVFISRFEVTNKRSLFKLLLVRKATSKRAGSLQDDEFCPGRQTVVPYSAPRLVCPVEPLLMAGEDRRKALLSGECTASPVAYWGTGAVMRDA